jgi:hypothetical protein
MKTNQSAVGPMDVAAGLPGQAVTGTQDSFPSVPGHGSPMHPGHDTRAQFSSNTRSKHKGFKREPDPDYEGGSGGADGSM